MLETLNIVFALMSLAGSVYAAWTGFRVVHKFEKLWDFKLSDCRKGRGSAVLFVAIIASTTGCVNFVVLNGSWMAQAAWHDIGEGHSLMWMIYHAFTTATIAAFHRTVFVLLAENPGLREKLHSTRLWGV